MIQMIYYRARYYDPTIGRFITPDPIGFMGGDTNFYRYVGNDPVNFTDPSGLIANMAGALAQLASINRGHSDGNPFNGIVPNTSVPKTAVPNSTMPKGKTVTQASKPKAAQSSSKTAQTNKGDGVKISGNVPKVVDECEGKPTLTIRIVRKWEDTRNLYNISSTLSKITIDEEPSFTAYILEEDGKSTTSSGQDKRIPLGTYNLSWHSSGRSGLSQHHHNKLLRLSNENVSDGRGILIHTGKDASWSEGCLLIGSSAPEFNKIKFGLRDYINKNGKHIYGDDTYDKFMLIVDKYACPKAIKGGKIKNVKLIISEEFIPMPSDDNVKKLWWGKE